MNTPDGTPKLTAEQQQALDACGGILQGPTYVLMRTDAVLSFFGYDSSEVLRRELQPAFDSADRRELAKWDVEEFLARMNRKLDAKP